MSGSIEDYVFECAYMLFINTGAAMFLSVESSFSNAGHALDNYRSLNKFQKQHKGDFNRCFNCIILQMHTLDHLPRKQHPSPAVCDNHSTDMRSDRQSRGQTWLKLKTNIEDNQWCQPTVLLCVLQPKEEKKDLGKILAEKTVWIACTVQVSSGLWCFLVSFLIGYCGTSVRGSLMWDRKY